MKANSKKKKRHCPHILTLSVIGKSQTQTFPKKYLNHSAKSQIAIFPKSQTFQVKSQIFHEN